MNLNGIKSFGSYLGQGITNVVLATFSGAKTLAHAGLYLTAETTDLASKVVGIGGIAIGATAFLDTYLCAQGISNVTHACGFKVPLNHLISTEGMIYEAGKYSCNSALTSQEMRQIANKMIHDNIGQAALTLIAAPFIGLGLRKVSLLARKLNESF